MAKNWNYAELVKSAKVVGGPEAYNASLESIGRNKGKKDMVPCTIGIAIGTVLTTLLIEKRVKFIIEKRKQNKKETIENKTQQDYDEKSEIIDRGDEED